MLVSEGISRGHVSPLPAATYTPGAAAAARALRLLSASHHLGRVLLSLQIGEQGPTSVVSLIRCLPGNTSLVVCDRDGLGLEFADTLVRRGAKILHLHCHETAYVQYKVKQWESQGVSVIVSSEDISNGDRAFELINDCKQRGAIDGLFIFATDKEKTPQLETAISNLDSITRIACPNIRYFAVIGEDDTTWRDIVNRRAHDGLPALSLCVDSIHRYKVTGEVNGNVTLSAKGGKKVPILWNNAIIALDKALASGETVVYAHAQARSVSNILKELSKIPGVNITNAATGRTTLEQVGADAGRAREVCNLLERTIGVHIEEEIAPKLTIAQLQNLQKDVEDVEKDPGGFAAYFSEFQSDELEATLDFCILPSLRDQSKEALNAIDSDQEFLCIIPGFEGHQRRLAEVSRRLRMRTAMLNLHRGGDLATIAEEKAQVSGL
ncbi:hypothetical protein ACJJTC_006052 [Scirpophaga incertulas]